MWFPDNSHQLFLKKIKDNLLADQVGKSTVSPKKNVRWLLSVDSIDPSVHEQLVKVAFAHAIK